MEVLIEQGRSVEKAIDKALKRLDVEKEKIDYEVIKREEKGFLGFIGGQPAVVKVWVKNKENGKKNRVIEEIFEIDEKRDIKLEPSPVCVDKSEGDEIKDILATILGHMGFEAEIEFQKKRSVYFFKINVDKELDGLIIGKKGMTLGALQHVVNRIMRPNGNGRRKQIVLDVSGYRLRRDDKLISRAKSLANKVKRSGNEIMMEQLNPSDRRVVHQALSKDNRIKTYTIGDGQYKNLIIAPAIKRRK